MHRSTNITGNPISNFHNAGIFDFGHLQHIDFQRLFSYKNALTFTGKEKDSETGFYYFGARYYDPSLSGLFLSVDPMADKYPSISPYAYCAWNPVKITDPSGTDTVYINRDGKEFERRPGGHSTFINVNKKWQEVPMPDLIPERTQSKENTSGEEYQKLDHIIAAAVGYFNYDKNSGNIRLYSDGNREIPTSALNQIPDLNPTLIKAIAIQESNYGKNTSDIMQSNKKGDWGKFKSNYGFANGVTPSKWQSLTGGIKILASKGFKGGITADGSFTFQGWRSATRAYNGGGNKNYVYYVYDQMFLKAEPR